MAIILVTKAVIVIAKAAVVVAKAAVFVAKVYHGAQKTQFFQLSFIFLRTVAPKLKMINLKT